VISVLDRTRQAVFRSNVAQRGDALELLRSLPDRNASVALFNPQHRSVLDHLKFGNDLGIDPDLSAHSPSSRRSTACRR
jgi:hypothetical protein